MRRALKNPDRGLSRIIATLRAIHWISSSAHWKVQNNYGDHLLFERVYNTALKGIDPLVERLIGYQGAHEFDEVAVSAMAQRLVAPGANTIESWCSRVLALESKLQAAIEAALKQNPPTGLRNFLEQLLDDHSEVVYLLQQRSGAGAPQPSLTNSGGSLTPEQEAALLAAVKTASKKSGLKFGRGLTLAMAREQLPFLRDAIRRRDPKAFAVAWTKAGLGGLQDQLYDSIIMGAAALAGATAAAAAVPGGAALGAGSTTTFLSGAGSAFGWLLKNPRIGLLVVGEPNGRYVKRSNYGDTSGLYEFFWPVEQRATLVTTTYPGGVVLGGYTTTHHDWKATASEFLQFATFRPGDLIYLLDEEGQTEISLDALRKFAAGDDKGAFQASRIRRFPGIFAVSNPSDGKSVELMFTKTGVHLPQGFMFSEIRALPEVADITFRDTVDGQRPAIAARIWFKTSLPSMTTWKLIQHIITKHRLPLIGTTSYPHAGHYSRKNR